MRASSRPPPNKTLKVSLILRLILHARGHLGSRVLTRLVKDGAVRWQVQGRCRLRSFGNRHSRGFRLHEFLCYLAYQQLRFYIIHLHNCRACQRQTPCKCHHKSFQLAAQASLRPRLSIDRRWKPISSVKSQLLLNRQSTNTCGRAESDC